MTFLDLYHHASVTGSNMAGCIGVQSTIISDYIEYLEKEIAKTRNKDKKDSLVRLFNRVHRNKKIADYMWEHRAEGHSVTFEEAVENTNK